MGTPRGVLAFVERLERRMADLLSEETHVILAYSGGLASTLVAMVARKRCDLVCVVAGVEDSAAVRAAKAAKATWTTEFNSCNPTSRGRVGSATASMPRLATCPQPRFVR